MSAASAKTAFSSQNCISPEPSTGPPSAAAVADGHLGVQAVGHDIDAEGRADPADAFGVEHFDGAVLGALAGGELVQVGAGGGRDARAGMP